jgi:hypothetical protein
MQINHSVPAYGSRVSIAIKKGARNEREKCREILISHYGFPMNDKPINKYRGSLVFDRKAIGYRRYMRGT